jgi:hypothetical protein
MNDNNVLRIRTGSFERVHGASQQPIGNKTIEAAYDDCKLQARGVCRSANFFSVKGFVHVNEFGGVRSRYFPRN